MVPIVFCFFKLCWENKGLKVPRTAACNAQNVFGQGQQWPWDIRLRIPIFTVQNVSEGSALEHNTYLDYSCDAGYFKPLPNPLQCKV
jgi:hypothetical protein